MFQLITALIIIAVTAFQLIDRKNTAHMAHHDASGELAAIKAQEIGFCSDAKNANRKYGAPLVDRGDSQ